GRPHLPDEQFAGHNSGGGCRGAGQPARPFDAAGAAISGNGILFPGSPGEPGKEIRPKIMSAPVSLTKYFKTALLNRWNLLATFGGLGVALLSGFPEVLLPLVLAAEIAYVAFRG